jgi:hypothetical protein
MKVLHSIYKNPTNSFPLYTCTNMEYRYISFVTITKIGTTWYCGTCRYVLRALWYRPVCNLFIRLFSCWLATGKRVNGCLNAIDWSIPTDTVVYPLDYSALAV